MTGRHMLIVQFVPRLLTSQQYTEWANKVSCCIAGCNSVNYGPI